MSHAVSPSSPDLLVAEDSAGHLHWLAGMLEQAGFRVRPAHGGTAVVEAACRQPPDLVLLDLDLPDISGGEVCRRLKAEPATSDIPVLFLCDNGLPGAKDRALAAGGADCITRPVQLAELVNRVRTQLLLRNHQRELDACLAQIKAQERLRDNLVQMAAHDMRSPLSVILMGLDILREAVAEESPAALPVLRNLSQSAICLREMISQFLDVSRLESNQLPVAREPCDLVLLTKSVLTSLAGVFGKREVGRELPETCVVPCDGQLIRRVIANLVANALKHTSERTEVRVRLACEPDWARVMVTNNGPGIPADLRQRIFEKFGQNDLHDCGVSSGLGLTFCRLAIDAHGGQIGIESDPGRGTTFWFTLPMDPAASAAPLRTGID